MQFREFFMRLGKILAAASAMVLATSPLAAQSDLETAREVYPIMIECSMVSALSAEYGYTARHSMEEWIELIIPTAEMIGADAEVDISKYGDDLIARMETDGVEQTQQFVLEKAKFCDEVLDSVG
jgi:hypothetical protein